MIYINRLTYILGLMLFVTPIEAFRGKYDSDSEEGEEEETTQTKSQQRKNDRNNETFTGSGISEKLKREYEALKKEYDALKKEHDALKREHEVFKIQLTDLRREYAQLKKEYVSTQHQNGQLLEENREMSRYISVIDNKFEQLKHKYHTLVAVNGKLEKEYQTYKDRALEAEKALHEKINLLIGIKETLEKQNKEQLDIISKLNGEVQKLKNDITRLHLILKKIQEMENK